MTNDEARNNDEILMMISSSKQARRRFLELLSFHPGFLDFARMTIRFSYCIRHFLRTCQSSTRSFGISWRKRDGRWKTSP